MHDDLLDKVSWNGFAQVRGPVRGLVVRFNGLNNTAMKDGLDIAELEWADQGALLVQAYQDPWGWMNDATRDLFDAVVDGLRARHRLRADLPLIAVGGSMGGHAALTWAFTSRHKVTAVQANCPVCDLPFHYTERPDLPRTMHHAFGPLEEDIGAAMRAKSPLHQVASLPDVPYQIIHGGKDQAVGKARHSDPLVAAMRQRGLRVDYLEEPEMRHCWPLTSHALHRRMMDFVTGQLAPA
jgi:alpha-beta hydrolase superfamily lysophospholipase